MSSQNKEENLKEKIFLKEISVSTVDMCFYQIKKEGIDIWGIRENNRITWSILKSTL